ncbi:hypothetical protein T459_19293 [Capsicum annuum]|uniref:Uncharacterized protein n=1 Tax=Capsicum annuum TaxID=4072 RepID=A0A2G2Z1J3_CAPAN|nr:hypothetical protein T459_19293 [Capsicum annuum]
MEVGTDGVAVITIFNPPLNALAIPIIAGLKEMWTEATMRNDVKAIVLTCELSQFTSFSSAFSLTSFGELCIAGPRPAWIKEVGGNGGRFSGGFDINVFQKVHETGWKVVDTV